MYNSSARIFAKKNDTLGDEPVLFLLGALFFSEGNLFSLKMAVKLPNLTKVNSFT